MKKTFYLLILSFISIVSSCSTDDLLDKGNNDSNWESKNISFKDFLNSEKSTKDFKKIEKYLPNSNITFNNSVDWVIDTTIITKISTKNLTTYTFAVKEKELINGFRNLVIRKEKNNTVIYLVHYPNGVDFTNKTSSKVELSIINSDFLSKSTTCYKVVIETVSNCSSGTCEWGWYLVETECPSGGSGGGSGGGTPTNPIPGGHQPIDGGGSGGSAPSFNTFLNMLTQQQLIWLSKSENSHTRNLLYQYLTDENFSYESIDYAIDVVDISMDGGYLNSDFYIETPTSDTPPSIPIFSEISIDQKIPNPLILKDGSSISINFGTTESDNKNANQFVSSILIDALKFSLLEANKNLASGDKITNIYIKATTNGDHGANSNHYNGTAIDISRINGIMMSKSGLTDQIIELQDAFNKYQYIRENFGPSIKTKYKIETDTWNYNHPVKGHKDHIHISIRKK